MFCGPQRKGTEWKAGCLSKKNETERIQSSKIQQNLDWINKHKAVSNSSSRVCLSNDKSVLGLWICRIFFATGYWRLARFSSIEENLGRPHGCLPMLRPKSWVWRNLYWANVGLILGLSWVMWRPCRTFFKPTISRQKQKKKHKKPPRLKSHFEPH